MLLERQNGLCQYENEKRSQYVNVTEPLYKYEEIDGGSPSHDDGGGKKGAHGRDYGNGPP